MICIFCPHFHVYTSDGPTKSCFFMGCYTTNKAKNTLQKYIAMQKHALLCCCVTAAVTKLNSQGCKSKVKLLSNVCAVKPDVLLFR